MTDSMFLDDVVGFLHNIDDPTVSGPELLLALDKEGPYLFPSDISSLFSLVDPEIPLHDGQTTDSGFHDTENIASVVSTPRITEVEDIRTTDALRRSHYRQKRKAEKNDLYAELNDLTTQLRTLQAKKAADRTRGLEFSSSMIWKALASRHWHERLMAEEQQRRLREAVGKRSALIRDLGEIVRKRISEDQQPGIETVLLKKARRDAPDVTFYEIFINELDDVYARTDRVFQESVSESLLMKPTNHELVGKRITPFPFERVRLLFDNIDFIASRRGYERIEIPGISNDTAVFKYRFQARVGDRVVSFLQHLITRRYTEADRVVLIWRKFAEEEGTLAGKHVDETGWNIIRQSVDGTGTLMESTSRYVPMSFGSVTTDASELKEFTDTIRSVGEEECQKCVRKLEALLLDDALGVC